VQCQTWMILFCMSSATCNGILIWKSSNHSASFRALNCEIPYRILLSILLVSSMDLVLVIACGYFVWKFDCGCFLK
jgi:hypothetical protein